MTRVASGQPPGQPTAGPQRSPEGEGPGRPTAASGWEGPLFLLLGLGLGGLLVLSGQAVYVAQGQMAAVAALLPVSYAFAAGMVASVNPCGVMLLPSLVAYSLAGQAEMGPSGWQRASGAILLGGMATLGFLAVFTAVGLVIGTGGRALAGAFPVGGVMVGSGLTALGAWLTLSGRSLGLGQASRALGLVRVAAGPRSMFLFGVGYAVASLACTLPIFLVVTGAALAAGDPPTALLHYGSYGLGMGVVLTAVLLGAAFFQGAVARSARRLVPYVHRLAASFLVGAGLFVTHYWLRALGLGG